MWSRGMDSGRLTFVTVVALEIVAASLFVDYRNVPVKHFNLMEDVFKNICNF